MKPKVTKEFIEFVQGEETIIIYKKYIQIIRENKDAKGCDIFVKDFEEPFFAPIDINLIES